MNTLSSALCCTSFLLAFLPPMPAQQARVEIANAGSKELKRAAYHLHMPAERLKNARQALQEATDLARRSSPVPVEQFYQLGDFWVQFNRPKAESAITGLLTTLRSAAQEAADASQYQRATGAAQILISSLAQIDSEQALDWARRWPAATSAIGQETRTGVSGNMEQQLRRSALQRLAYSDPEAALKLWSESADSAPEDYYIRGPLAAQLARTGHAEEAGKIIDRTLAELANAKPDPSLWNSYASFLTSLPQVAPERFIEAFRLWAKNAPESPTMGGTALPSGDAPIPLDTNEATGLNIMRSLVGRPETMIKALDSMPTLKAKLDQAGGIDKALFGPTTMPGVRRMSDGSGRIANRDDNKSSPTTVFNELRGKAAKNPQLVRSRLAAMVTEPDNVAQLLQLAMISTGQDPDLGCLAVEVARPVVLRVDPPLRQFPLFEQLVQATRQCEGEIDADLIKQGFLLADELREEQQQREQDQGFAGPRPGYAPPDQLEAMLISELARDNFDAAIRYVHTMTDDQQKFAALLRIVQSCRQY